MFPRSPSGFTDIKKLMFSSSSASLKYEFQSLSEILSFESVCDSHATYCLILWVTCKKAVSSLGVLGHHVRFVPTHVSQEGTSPNPLLSVHLDPV